MAWRIKQTDLKWIAALFIIISAVTFAGVRHMGREADIKTLAQSMGDAERVKEEIRKKENRYKELEARVGEMKTRMKSGQMLAGMLDVQGKGVVLTLEDNNDKNVVDMSIQMLTIHDSDILNVLEELANAGAEALSVNDERIITTTCIKSGGPVILINGNKLTSPFVIKAIGEPGTLLAVLEKDDNIIGAMKKDRLGVKAEKAEGLLIPGYKGSTDFRYSSPAGPGGLGR